MKTIQSKSILFVTGAFVSHTCWDDWRAYFEGKGYKTIAPPWPHKDATPQELRKRQPNDVALATLTTVELIDHYASFAKRIDLDCIVFITVFYDIMIDLIYSSFKVTFANWLLKCLNRDRRCISQLFFVGRATPAETMQGLINLQ